MSGKTERKLTGWHVFGIFGGAFGVIIAVNLALAYNAVKTFPGLEVKNSYVASQTFNARKAAQESLGWDVEALLDGDRLILSITDENGRPVQAGKLSATVGRPTNVSDDRIPDFTFNGQAYVAPIDLNPGNWDVWLKATALDGTEFEQRLEMTIGG
ncbi:FixH family protein [Primorskyibacter sp. 2E233]|uniref:FixH family protein n=1 Tax=Primorskyibacter sp. 2E233 TaxID=3413431 RepID=UPI003BF2C702